MLTTGAKVVVKLAKLNKYSCVGADRVMTVVLKSEKPTPVAKDWPPNKSIDVVADRGRGAMATALVADVERPTLMLFTATDPVPATANWNDSVHEYVPAGRRIGKLFLVAETTADVVCV